MAFLWFQNPGLASGSNQLLVMRLGDRGWVSPVTKGQDPHCRQAEVAHGPSRQWAKMGLLQPCLFFISFMLSLQIPLEYFYFYLHKAPAFTFWPFMVQTFWGLIGTGWGG